ncbi:hypothetical protein R4P64_30440 [Rhodococcus sp. IEGM 1366]|uniref:hypothetical protein n=1 Tax=Rhodococcus sp. IEGM 1366 TaxID=3082223 RepID=UPI002954C43D|nr:hypothetical protein [Rhodococcus sp. IEGM 1366]MDV8070846.1 hypothetical protein [Rhodococcus sp. IEGM 1366]
MHSTNDFMVNGVITSSPDTARAELAAETSTERKALKVHDLQTVLCKADKWAESFDSTLSRYHLGGVLNCNEIDATTELVEALGKSEEAEGLRDQHNDWSGWLGDDRSELEKVRHALHAPHSD